MGPGEGGNAPPRNDASLREYVSVLRRRKRVILQAALIVPLAAVALAVRQEPVYQAWSEVLIERTGTSGLTGNVDATAASQPERTLQTQADLARTPDVASRTLNALGIEDRTPEELLLNSTVTTKPNSDILRFSVFDADPRLAPQLATQYAREFTKYRMALDTRSVRRAHKQVQTQRKQLEAEGQRATAIYRTLVEKEQELATLEALLTSNASVVRPAGESTKIRPRPKRNAAFGLVLGLGLGVVLAFFFEALDTRVRTTSEIERRLGLPLLARIPEPPRWVQRNNKLVMLAAPNSLEAEAFRVLRTNLDFFNLEHGARTVLVTSAVQNEGKSTTVANLAVALSRAGQRVVLVDLDLRRPTLDKFFGLQGAPGLTDVAMGEAQLASFADTDVSPDGQGRLDVLTTGRQRRDTGEFIASGALDRILAELREKADIVLIDSAPILAVGDAMALSAKVDGIILLTRLNVVRRAMLDDLRRMLGTLPAAKLGFVVTGAELEQEFRYGYGYGYGYGYAESARRAQEERQR